MASIKLILKLRRRSFDLVNESSMSSFVLGCPYASCLLKHDAGVCIKSGNKALTFKRTQSDRRTFSNVPRGMLCKICDRILFEQAPSTATDKLSKENHLQLHSQTPRRSLKVTECWVELPPCCANLLHQDVTKAKPFRSQFFCVSDLEWNLIACNKSRDLEGLKRSHHGESGRSNGLM